MDRRQQKSRAAIFTAFTDLLNTQPYASITIQKIIDEANIGRSTFYAHFETKDDLLRALCRELFDHIIDTARDRSHSHCLYYGPSDDDSLFLHILLHLRENDRNILKLLSGENHDLFLHYFKECMNDLVRTMVLKEPSAARADVPTDFLINHISGSFVDMVGWWLAGKQVQTPQELDRYFRAVISPLI